MIQVRLAATLAALTLVLVGCSDDDPEPQVDLTPSTTPSTSTPPTPDTTPTVTPLDPEETIREWVAAHNQAMAGGDVGPVRQLSSPDCTSCADLIDPVERIYAAGGHFETAGWKILRSRLTKDKPSSAEVTAALSLAGGTTYSSSTADPVDYDPERRIAIFELTKSGGTWAVSLIGFLR